MTQEPPGPPSGNYPPPPPGGYPPPPQGGGYPPPQGGGYPQPQGYGVQPNNNLVWGILVTLFCCLPFGIVSIVKATQVSGLWAQGQQAEAQAAANDAKKWAMWGAIVGGVLIAVYVVLMLIGVVAGINNSS